MNRLSLLYMSMRRFFPSFDILEKVINTLTESERRTLPIQLDITNACNLSCIHCYHDHHSNKGALNLQEWISVLKQYDQLLKKLKLKPKITICGGEPLLNRDLPLILERIEKSWGRDVPMTILTNGTLLPKATLEPLKKFKKVALQVSLDGSRAETHDRVRGTGNFQRSVRGIEALQKMGFKVVLQATLSHKNSPEIESFFKLAQKLKVNAMNFVRLVAAGNGKDLISSQSDRPLLGMELKSALEQIVSCSETYRVYTSRMTSLFFLVDPSAGANEKFGFAFTVGYKGDIKVSSRIDYSVGNIKDSSLDSLFLKHPTFKKLRQGKISVCGSCEHFKRCGGSRNASFAAYGHFFGPDPGCWLISTNNKEKTNEAV